MSFSILDLFFIFVGILATWLPFAFGEVPVFSLTGFSLIANFVFVLVFGPYVYRGGILSLMQDPQFDVQIYLLFISQLAIFSLSAIFVWKLCPTQPFLFKPRPGLILRSRLLYFISFLSIFLILLVIGKSLPLLGLVIDGSAIGNTLRSSLNYGGQAKAFGIFNSYRLFILFAINITLVTAFSFWRRSRQIFFFQCGVLLLLSILNLEKATIFFVSLSFLLTLAFSSAIPGTSKVSIPVVLMLLPFALLFLAVVFLFANNFEDGFFYFFQRMSGQSAYVPVQIQLEQDKIPLYLDGIRISSFLKPLFGSNHLVDASSDAFTFMSRYTGSFYELGSSAGLACSDAYLILGNLYPFGLLISASLQFLIDKTFFLALLRSSANLPFGTSNLLFIYSSYSLFACFGFMFTIGSLFGFLSLSTFFQPEFLTILAPIPFLYKIYRKSV